MVSNRFTKFNRKRTSLEKARLKEIDSKNSIVKSEFESQLNNLQSNICKEVYRSYKLMHNGIVSYKTFENCYRKMNRKSLSNLLNYDKSKLLVDDFDRPFDDAFGIACKDLKDYRVLSKAQVRQVRSLGNKLSYYTAKREFTSKKSGKYNMRIAFITLTLPAMASDLQGLKAFEHFLDYLRRTANCVYIWKKEIGESGNRLHFHIMINNFIPYYIVNWKWKRLLLNEGVKWSTNENGKDTTSHYRIELPRNKKQTASYISKYVAKDCELPKEFGYIWGCSEVLKELKEIVKIEGELKNDELWQLIKNNKTISTDYVSIICTDLMKVRKIAPEIFSIFEKQFYEFREKISLPQRFLSV